MQLTKQPDDSTTRGRRFRAKNAEHYRKYQREYKRRYRAMKREEARQEKVEKSSEEFDKLKQRIGENYEDLV